MASRDETPRTLLGALIRREQLTLDEAARRVEQAGSPVVARHLGRLTRGEQTRPNPALARALQAAFGYPVEELLAAYDPTALAPAGGGAAPAPTDVAEVVTMAADRARRFLHLETASDGAVDALHEDVRDLAVAYPQRPLHELLPHLTGGQDVVFGLLERPQRPEHSRRLYFLAGALGGMLGKASHDLADPHAAQTQLRTAWMCAEAADHHGLRAWVAGLQSLVAYWAQRPSEAIRYAQRGAGSAATAGSTAAVWLASNEARAWALLGNGAQAHEAIERADSAWSSVGVADDLDELGGIATFSRTRATYYAAEALAWLPADGEATARQAEQAVAAYADPLHPDWAFGDAAGSRCGLAIGRIRTGDLDGAAEAVEPVLALPPEQRINGIVKAVNHVHRVLAEVSAPAATTLQQEIELFTRTPLAALPR